MRVKISTNSPLAPLKAWFPIQAGSAQNISSFKTLLCASLPVLRGVSSSLRLSIDGYELLDSSELTIIRDGDLICIDALDTPRKDTTAALLERVVAQAASQAVPPGSETTASHKRKRRLSTLSSLSSVPDTESASPALPPKPKSKPKITRQAHGGVFSTPRISSSSSSASDSESTTSESDSSDEESESDDSLHPTTLPLREAEPVRVQAKEDPNAKSHIGEPTTFVPPGYGKPQTRSRNLRRRIKRMHERDAAGTSEEGPVSGANATVPETKLAVPTTVDAYANSELMSLSLRNKNKAKNFRALIGKPLPPKIIFGDDQGYGSTGTATPAEDTCKSQMPSTRTLSRLIPPSSRSSLPPNLFVTSVDVQANLHRKKKKRKTSEEEVTEVVVSNSGVDARLESLAEERWETLDKLTNEKDVKAGTVVGYKALGIDPITYSPSFLLTVGRVMACDARAVFLRPLREREKVSFGGPMDEGDAEVAVQEHTWEDILAGDWRVVE